MTDFDSCLAACRQFPAEDTPRLVLADIMEEQLGRARAAAWLRDSIRNPDRETWCEGDAEVGLGCPIVHPRNKHRPRFCETCSMLAGDFGVPADLLGEWGWAARRGFIDDLRLQGRQCESAVRYAKTFPAPGRVEVYSWPEFTAAYNHHRREWWIGSCGWHTYVTDWEIASGRDPEDSLLALAQSRCRGLLTRALGAKKVILPDWPVPIDDFNPNAGRALIGSTASPLPLNYQLPGGRRVMATSTAAPYRDLSQELRERLTIWNAGLEMPTDPLPFAEPWPDPEPSSPGSSGPPEGPVGTG